MYCALFWGVIIIGMVRDDKNQVRAPATKEELQEVQKELKAASEKLKALEIRVGAVEQNLLGN